MARAVVCTLTSEEINYKLEFIFNKKFHNFEFIKNTIINQSVEYSNLKQNVQTAQHNVKHIFCNEPIG